MRWKVENSECKWGGRESRRQTWWSPASPVGRAHSLGWHTCLLYPFWMTDNSGTSAVSLSQMHVQQMTADIVLNGKLEFFITFKNAQEMSVPCGWDLSNLPVFWFPCTRGGAGLKINRCHPGLQGSHTYLPGPCTSWVPPTLASVSLHLSPQWAYLQQVLNKWHLVNVTI